VEINHVAKKETKQNVQQKVSHVANHAHQAIANAVLIVVKMEAVNLKIANAKALVARSK